MRGIPDHAVDQLIVAGTALPADQIALVPRSADVSIRGWIILPAGVPDTVSYRIDGGVLRPARARMPRPDVADVMSAPWAVACGFRILLPRGTLRDGAHAVTVFYTDRANGAQQALPSAVRLRVAG